MGIKYLKCQFENPDTVKFCGECGTCFPRLGIFLALIPKSTQRRIDPWKHPCLELFDITEICRNEVL